MRVVFAGTPDFSIPCLEALYSSPDIEVVGVYTQPDRPAGRGKKLQQSPIKKLALSQGSEVFQPLSFKRLEEVEHLQSLHIDLMVVTAYGIILPQRVLDIPTFGCVNIHASLLPRWRGAAPIQRAIQYGDNKAGVTMMQMEAGLDTGPMLAKTEIEIEDSDNGGSLHDKLSILGGKLLQQNLPFIEAGSLKPVVQDDGKAVYAAKLNKHESPLDWRKSAIELERKIRAFNPWPTTTLEFSGITMKVHSARIEPGAEFENSSFANPPKPGSIIRADRNGIVVLTGDGLLSLTILQKPGGKPMSSEALLNGVTIEPGMSFNPVSTS
ncbi:MAG: methionyl-tRNA formyltransferase [Gammaproteobacteria bacterium]|nr:methionyl-tRNA formyltransferase [Gammaproteobacteria bacterium]